MKIGIGLPNQIRNVDATVIPRWAARAERAGFAKVSTLGRIAYPGVTDTVALSAAAGATETIELFTGVLLATVWPPVLLAKEVADLDRVSGGRLTLGLGIGLRSDDFVVDGLEMKGLGARIDADLETLRSVWDGAPIGGGDNPGVPAGSRRVPLVLGGTSPASYRRMAAWGDGYIAPGQPTSLLGPYFEAARRAWRDAGRPGEPRLYGLAYFVFGDADHGRANVGDYYSMFGDYRHLVVDSIAAGADEVRRTLKAFADLGVDEVLFSPATSDLDEVERLAETVL